MTQFVLSFTADISEELPERVESRKKHWQSLYQHNFLININVQVADGLHRVFQCYVVHCGALTS